MVSFSSTVAVLVLALCTLYLAVEAQKRTCFSCVHPAGKDQKSCKGIHGKPEEKNKTASAECAVGDVCVSDYHLLHGENLHKTNTTRGCVKSPGGTFPRWENSTVIKVPGGEFKVSKLYCNTDKCNDHQFEKSASAGLTNFFALQFGIAAFFVGKQALSL